MERGQEIFSEAARLLQAMAADFRESILDGSEAEMIRLQNCWSDEAGEQFRQKMALEQMRLGDLYTKIEEAALTAERIVTNHEYE